ncbi:MAG: (2Fe-2S)-binding protein [Pyrinomonadaceae bacterium]|nr:(2Fe-2S)-binding protein [Pyrinomonadaceae bacterium]
MAKISFNLNGEDVTVDADPGTPLLWILREELDLTGPKYSCGIAVCGACAIHINGEATPSCITPMSLVEGRKITTIEGLSQDNDHPLQQAWTEEQVPQCGYCQSGMIMFAASLLNKNKKPSREEIDEGMNRVLCRCGTYLRVRKAIEKVIRENG